jgi:hypothetical protein
MHEPVTEEAQWEIELWTLYFRVMEEIELRRDIGEPLLSVHPAPAPSLFLSSVCDKSAEVRALWH